MYHKNDEVCFINELMKRYEDVQANPHSGSCKHQKDRKVNIPK